MPPFDPASQETNPDRRYYGSNSKSAINNNFVPTRRGRPGTPLPTAPIGGITNSQETNADKKYYSNPPRPAAGQARQPTIQEMISGSDGAGKRLKPLLVKSVADVYPVRDTIAQFFAAGAPYVIVQVANDDIDSRLRTALDLAEARKQITPSQRSNVRIENIPVSAIEVAARAFGTVKSAGPIEEVPDEDVELSEAQMRNIVGLSKPAEMQASVPIPVMEGKSPAEVPMAAIVTATEDTDDTDEDVVDPTGGGDVAEEKNLPPSEISPVRVLKTDDVVEDNEAEVKIPVIPQVTGPKGKSAPKAKTTPKAKPAAVAAPATVEPDTED